MAIGRCFECERERELLTYVSAQVEYGRTYTYRVENGHCQMCLDIAQWTSIIIDDYRRIELWKQFAESRKYDLSILEFKPNYPKIISVKDRTYKNNEYVHEYIDVGFRMNGTGFYGTVHVYKGNINGMQLLEMKSGNKRFTYDDGLLSESSKLLKLVEKQLVPKLKKKIDPYIMGQSYRHLKS